MHVFNLFGCSLIYVGMAAAHMCVHYTQLFHVFWGFVISVLNPVHWVEVPCPQPSSGWHHFFAAKILLFVPKIWYLYHSTFFCQNTIVSLQITHFYSQHLK